MTRPTSLPLLPPWGVQSCFFCFLEVLLLLVKKPRKKLEKTNKNKIVHFKGWVVTESWGVQFCLVCFLINNLITRFTSFQNCTCLLSMKAMLLNKKENIIWFEWRTISLKQVEPKKKIGGKMNAFFKGCMSKKNGRYRRKCVHEEG